MATTVAGGAGAAGTVRARLAAPATAPSAPLRLTARGRFVIRLMATLLGTIVILGALAMLSRGPVLAALTQPTLGLPHSVVVRDGETLWQIAARELPSLDRRDAIARIQGANGMTTRDLLIAGSTVEIPTV